MVPPGLVFRAMETRETAPRHWADAAADRLMERGGSHVLNTGITPSGPIHVGHSREILTADAVHRVLRERGAASHAHYIGDTFDPLRRVYPFLDESFQEHVGKPLSVVPCPCGGHDSYADHFLAPFLEGVAALGVDLEVIKAHELYARGDYNGPSSMPWRGVTPSPPSSTSTPAR